MSWFTRLNIPLATKENATHMIVGSEPGKHYGIIAYADNQFMAYRIRQAVMEDGGKDIKVMPYTEKAVSAVEQNIETLFFKQGES